MPLNELWVGWRQEHPLSFVMLDKCNNAFIPLSTVLVGLGEAHHALLHVIGNRYTANDIAKHIRSNWLPTHWFQVRQVMSFSFLLTLPCDDNLGNVVEQK